MKTSFEEIAKAIWRQALVENEAVVTLGGDGAREEKSDAVYSGWQVHCGGGGWKSDAVRQAQSMRIGRNA
jgi:hypothetical protein